MHRPELVKAYFAYAGGPYGAKLRDDSAARALKENGVAPFVAHCRRDPVNRFAGTEEFGGSAELAAFLAANGIEHETLFPDDATHDLTDAVRAALRAFCETHVGRA